MFTDNEKKIIRSILSSPKTPHSINELAKETNLSPNGAYKILKKFEKENLLKITNISNIKSYKLNFNENKLSPFLELCLSDKLDNKLSNRYNDLSELNDIVKICIIFGSYVKGKKDPSDIDILFIIEKKDFDSYKNKLIHIKELLPLRLQDVIQTKEDFMQNFLNEDKVLKSIINEGIILWGLKDFIELVKNANKN